MSESKKLLSPHAIERWTPPCLRYVVGCSELKKHFGDMLRADGSRPQKRRSWEAPALARQPLFGLTCGPSCVQIWNLLTLDTCGQCRSCLQFDPRYMNAGLQANLFARAEAQYGPIHYVPVNCSTITTKQENSLGQITEWDGLTVIHLDDFQVRFRRLTSKVMHLFDAPNLIWIASTPSYDPFSPFIQDVLGHFSVVLSTTPATLEEFLGFLQDRCNEWGITARDRVSLILLAEHSKSAAHAAIGFLAMVAGRKGRSFDGTDVEEYFPPHQQGDEDA